MPAYFNGTLILRRLSATPSWPPVFHNARLSNQPSSQTAGALVSSARTPAYPPTQFERHSVGRWKILRRAVLHNAIHGPQLPSSFTTSNQRRTSATYFGTAQLFFRRLPSKPRGGLYADDDRCGGFACSSNQPNSAAKAARPPLGTPRTLARVQWRSPAATECPHLA